MPIQNLLRQKLREPVKYTQAVLRWRRFSFNEAPPIFGNAKPKSGSHLLLQILNGFTKIMPYTYTAALPVRTIRKEGGRRPADEIAADLAKIKPSVIGWGYVDSSPKNLAVLSQEGRVNYFIYRDPRDMLVSQVFFATDMHTGHGMHDYYQSLPNFDARLKVAITGIDQDGLKMVSVRQRYEGVFAWLNQPHVMCIRFEDLINNRDETLLAMLDEVEKTGYKIPTPREKALEILIEAINPKKSHTFRSGKTGGWANHFSEENKTLFKEVSGDLLAKLGYEKNNDW
ncbi:MAG: sulfotransferase domain-containing protein [Anaerolineales bacterium]|nr:sulfotransferase domain-containing protein [Anaerolineales bacterium]